MPRAKRVRSPALVGLVERDSLLAVDLLSARVVSGALRAYVVPGVASSYATGAQQFVEQHREWLERERLRQVRAQQS